jgi:hypothetical protein
MSEDLVPYSVDDMVDSIATPVLGRGFGALGQAIRALNSTAAALSGQTRVAQGHGRIRGRGGARVGRGGGAFSSSMLAMGGKRKRTKTRTKTKNKTKGKKKKSAKSMRKKKSKALTKPGPLNLYYKYGAVETIQSRMQNVNTFEAAGQTDFRSTKVDFGHHSTPLFPLFRSICRCFINMLCQKAGGSILRWSDPVSANFVSDVNHEVSFGFTRRPGADFEVVTAALGVANETLDALAYRLYLAAIAAFDDSAGFEPHILFTEYGVINGGSLAKVNLSNAYVDLRSHSKMRMQNRTPAAVDGENQTTNVASNPLVFHSFDIGGNAFQWKALGQQEATTATSGQQYTASVSTGYNTKVIHDLSIRAVPPKRADLRYCNSSKRVHVKPGDFLQSVVKYNRVMRLDKLMTELWPWLISSTDGGDYQSRVPVGVSRGFVVDKYLDSGNETSNIKVGVELTAKVCVRIFAKPGCVKGVFTNASTLTDTNDQGLVLV